MKIETLNEIGGRFASLLLPNVLSLVPNFEPIFSTTDGGTPSSRSSEKKRALARSSLRVAAELTPTINKVVCDVSARLSIQRDWLDVYVYPSTELNAFCYIDELPITVGVSSGLVNNLESDELAFVIGHEVGHVFFKEISNFSPSIDCLEDLIIARSIELSVDRIGLIASTRIEGAFSAILKTMSGLGDRHLRKDFNKLLDESREILKDAKSDRLIYSSHPPLALRFKSLVSFSTSNEFFELIGRPSESGISLAQANRLILASLHSSVDSHAHSEIDCAIQEMGMWIACMLLLNKRSMSLGSLRSTFSDRLQKDDIEKSYIFVTGYTSEIQAQVLQEKLFAAILNGYQIAPRRTYGALKKFVADNPEFKVLLNSPELFKQAPKIMEIIA